VKDVAQGAARVRGQGSCRPWAGTRGGWKWARLGRPSDARSVLHGAESPRPVGPGAPRHPELLLRARGSGSLSEGAPPDGDLVDLCRRRFGWSACSFSRSRPSNERRRAPLPCGRDIRLCRPLHPVLLEERTAPSAARAAARCPRRRAGRWLHAAARARASIDTPIASRRATSAPLCLRA